jgi:hypothetical protein
MLFLVSRIKKRLFQGDDRIPGSTGITVFSVPGDGRGSCSRQMQGFLFQGEERVTCYITIAGFPVLRGRRGFVLQNDGRASCSKGRRKCFLFQTDAGFPVPRGRKGFLLHNDGRVSCSKGKKGFPIT